MGLYYVRDDHIKLPLFWCLELSIPLLPGCCKSSSPNKNVTDLSRLKAFADDKISVAEKLKFVSGRVETLWQKEKMLVTSIFSFPNSVFFSKDLSF